MRAIHNLSLLDMGTLGKGFAFGKWLLDVCLVECRTAESLVTLEY